MATSPRARPVTFLVDRSMYGERYAPPRDVYGDLDRVVRPDLYYHYATPICAQRWMDVCDDPAYGHAELLDEVETAMPEVVTVLKDLAAGKAWAELCSLGPGDGSVDERMLRGLAGGFRIASYTGLDFSFELLRRSVHRIAHADGLPDDLPIRAVCGDFTDLSAVTLPPSDPRAVRVFALTGFTFGNYAEDALLRNIGALMAPGDYLFLDARLHRFGPLPDDLDGLDAALGGARAAYDVGSVRRFVLGPVEVATTAADASLAVAFEVRRSLTDVPDAVNLVLYCTGLDAEMRLTGEPVRRDRVDLAVTTAYHLPALASWLERPGLAPVWQRSRGDMAFFLLRK